MLGGPAQIAGTAGLSGAIRLKGEGVAVDEIRQTPLNEIEVSGTPMSLLVDSGGVVRIVWVGKLPRPLAQS
ncbi:MAG: hypothetical protein LAP21_11600 [Acidobacteriia bacterium]|nr:hypothetical protein [Terriglobia bacterium]